MHKWLHSNLYMAINPQWHSQYVYCNAFESSFTNWLVQEMSGVTSIYLEGEF